uniref:NADH-ubiquinone oxidoreductase chain 4L n=1 Tax=Discolomatidae sp. 3 ACP-2013 TaxID=1434486 RepID=A0A3G3FWY4_9CUCU|nr:NADH dehydrogenase subunit 4L [Discolomatidae sp. 3 ACP-2013]
MMIYMLMFMFFFSILFFSLNHVHLLVSLMSIEFLMLTLFLSLCMYLNMNLMEFYFSMIYLTIMVCESVLGLSILVSMVRLSGNDYMKSFNLLW